MSAGSRRWLFFSLLCLLSFFILYSPLVLHGQPLLRDDLSLITPLEKLSSLTNYFTSWKEGRIIDIAPVRDFSLWLDILLAKHLSFSVFHLTNFLLWIACLAIAKPLIEKLLASNNMQRWLLLILFFHPVFVSSVSWISARKHLLAFFFILLASKFFLEKKRHWQSLTLLSYVLSLLSNPIFITWPIWALAYEHFEKKIKINWYQYFPFFLFMLSFAAINYWYYQSIYLIASSENEKFLQETNWLGMLILAAGRSFFQLIVPLYVSPVDYIPGSYKSLIGVVLFVFFLTASIKKLGLKKTFIWSLLFFLPLFTLNFKPTIIFLSDTYLLLPGFGILLLLGQYLENQRNRKFTAAFLTIFALLCIWESAHLSRSYLSSQKLFAYAYKKEPTPKVKFIHGIFLVEEKKNKEAAQLAMEIMESHNEAPTLLALAISQDETLSLSKRIQFLEENLQPNAQYAYQLASLYARQSNFPLAAKKIYPYLSEIQKFREDTPTVAAEGLWFLEKAKDKNAKQTRELVESQLNQEQKKLYQKRKQELSSYTHL